MADPQAPEIDWRHAWPWLILAVVLVAVVYVAFLWYQPEVLRSALAGATATR